MRDIDKAVSNVNNTILAVSALTNFVATMTNLGGVTEEITATARQVRGILDTNAPSIQVAITNIAVLSQKMQVIADSLEGILLTNTGDVMDAIKSVKDTSAELKQLVGGLQAGQGVAGGLLKDEQMRTNFATLLVSLNGLADQFTQFGERLNEEGIWKSLWKPKTPPTNAPKR
jgi:ABC-type transporter Mla subunit MlaD